MKEIYPTEEELLLRANEEILRSDGFILIATTGNKSAALQKMSGLDEAQEFVLIMRTYLAYLKAITAFCAAKTDGAEEALFLIKRFERDAVEAFMKAGDL